MKARPAQATDLQRKRVAPEGGLAIYTQPTQHSGQRMAFMLANLLRAFGAGRLALMLWRRGGCEGGEDYRNGNRGTPYALGSGDSDNPPVDSLIRVVAPGHPRWSQEVAERQR